MLTVLCSKLIYDYTDSYAWYTCKTVEHNPQTGETYRTEQNRTEQNRTEQNRTDRRGK